MSSNGHLSQLPHWTLSADVDTSVPSVARMYDYMLGGKDNFAIDRERVQQAIEADPVVPQLARANRAFLQRAVRFLAGECGIAQFIDIGTGLPTQQNVHQVAQAINPDACVVYVDNDPVVSAHGRAILADNARTTVLQADLREPGAILSEPELLELIDFGQPVAVLAVTVLHFVPDEADPVGIMATVRHALAPGSYLALTHACGDIRPTEASKVAEVYRHTATPGTPRSREQIQTFFGDFELVSPGLVWVPQWRPAPTFAEQEAASAEEAVKIWFLAGVGRKPEASADSPT